MQTRKTIYRLISIGVALSFIFVMGMASVGAQDDTADEPVTEGVVVDEEAAMVDEEVDPATVMATLADVQAVQTNLDWTWIAIAGFLVFFMQAGFAMLEGGFIRHTGVVNSLAENFMDACVTGIMFFLVGFGLAYGSTLGAGTYEGGMFLLGGIDGTIADDTTFLDFFFQFAFAGAAATIATGAMAERTDFRGKLIYSAILGAVLYPVVVHWTWGGGLLSGLGFIDFAGSTIVHQFGGIIALVGAIIVGPRVGRVFGSAPRPSNFGLAALGTFILWFGWYGFNVGSTLAASDITQMGLVAVNTTLAAAAGALGAMFFIYFRTGKWDLAFILNGSLAGLVGITAGCASVAPLGALIIGLTAGIVVVLAVDAVEAAKVDDAVGAFAVHGACGALGSLAIGFWGVAGLNDGAAGLFMGGGVDLLITQLTGVAIVTVWAVVTGVVMFGALRAAGLLRMPQTADNMGIDAYEHGASLWPDVLPVPSEGAGD